MARAFTQQEYALLESRRKQVAMIYRIMAVIVPVEMLLIFFVFAFLLDFGAVIGLVVALLLSATVLIPLVILHRIRVKIDRDLQGQLAGEYEGIVEKVWYGSQVQFARILINGEQFQIPHELVQSIEKSKYVRVVYAQSSRIILSVSP